MTASGRTVRIAPSLLSADFARAGAEVTAVIEAGADLIHFDVMDNHYVPNLTIGPMVCSAIAPYCQRGGAKVPIDVHLMVEPVDVLIPLFAQAGASIISFHPEASAREVWLEVDGGMNAKNIARVVAAGADTLVAGSAVFSGGDYRRTIQALRAGAAEAPMAAA